MKKHEIRFNENFVKPLDLLIKQYRESEERHSESVKGFKKGYTILHIHLNPKVYFKKYLAIKDVEYKQQFLYNKSD